MMMIWARRALLVALGLLGIGVSLAALEALLRPTGIFELLGVRYHGLLGAGLIIACLSSLLSWLLARDVATGSLGIAPNTDPAIAAAVERLLPRFQLPSSPAIGIYDNASPNAFAVGRTRGSALLAVSRGLTLADPALVEVVLCHQLARIERGDVITQILVQGLTQAFTLFPTRIYALILGTALRTSEDETPTDWTEFLFVRMLEALFTPLTSLLARHIARGAESAADRRTVAILGKNQVFAALTGLTPIASLQPYREIFVQPLVFLAPVKPGWGLLSFHRSLARRIAAVGAETRGRSGPATAASHG